MTARELKPRHVTAVTTPQCCVEVDNAYCYSGYLERRSQRMARTGFDPGCCSRASSVEIDGKPYCRQHGGSIAIEILVAQDKAKHLEE